MRPTSSRSCGQHVQLKPAGAVFKGLCPFHKEKTPSFIVTPARGRCHCFGCGAGGDVISFLMEVEGVTFPEAVEILARPLDIDLSELRSKEDESEGERRAFHRANEAALKLWQRGVVGRRSSARAALAYLTGRGFGEKVLRDYDVGLGAGAAGGWLEPRLRQGGVDRELALRRGSAASASERRRPVCLFPRPDYLSYQESSRARSPVSAAGSSTRANPST